VPNEGEALSEALGLKDLPRAGWLRAGVGAPESVAAHSWGVALLTAALLPDGLDLGRALLYAVLHDLAEVRVGDVTPADGVSPADKAAREAAAMADLCASLPRGSALLAAFAAYEAQEDDEARFVRQLDRLDLGLTARRYGVADPSFLASARAALTDPHLRRLLDPNDEDTP
jgi:putative hydrolase of HD superfamily